MNRLSARIIGFALLLLPCVTASAQPTNDAAIRRAIESVVPDLGSAWILETNNSQIAYFTANKQYLLERKYSSEGRNITISAVSDDQQIRDARTFLGSLEQALANSPNHTTTADGGPKWVLWDVHPDWIVIQSFKGDGFQIAGVHRSEAVTFAIHANQQDFSKVSRGLEKKLKKFPKTGFQPVRPEIDKIALRIVGNTNSPVAFIIQPVEGNKITSPATACIRFIESLPLSESIALCRVEIRPIKVESERVDLDVTRITCLGNKEQGLKTKVTMRQASGKWLVQSLN